tara:strand:+ start:21076 stop:21855 length:780 start_codon:yes stop_codon:yes gene_type:complete
MDIKGLKMFVIKRYIVFMFALALLVSCKQKASESTKAFTEAKTSEIIENNSNGEWMVLFDGTSFDKWRGYLQDDIPEAWRIEGDEMVFTPSEKHGNNIITKQKFESFILSLEWKISEGGNSGFFWGVHEDENLKEAYQTGPEIQIIDNERHPDAKVKPKTHQAGALYDMVQPSQDVCKPAGQWNTCVLEIDHGKNQGKVTLNGVDIVEFPVHGKPWDDMVDNSKFKGWEYFGKFRTGYIGLQDHGNKVSFKNIKIKELK